jgi:NitT/TauT family transport system substrate-binding protein
VNARIGATIGIIAVIVVAGILVYFSTGKSTEVSASNTVRIGYFPNLSHAQALVGEARGMFEKSVGENILVQYKRFNAGPSAIEALFTNQIDIAYVGPSPTINGYIRSNDGLKIVAGAASGGVVFVVRADSNIESPSDFVGKRLAAPQYGNTQDISLKSYLADHNYKLAQYGGNVHVLPVKNSDIMALFIKKELDGAWVPEPWGTLLVKNANGKIFLDERDLWERGEFATTLLIVSERFLQEHPDLVKKVLIAHVETTLWINEHPAEAEEIVNEQIKKISGKSIPADVLHESFSKIEFTYEPMSSSVMRFADEAHELDFFSERPELSGIYYTELLNEVLKEIELSLIR